MPDKSSARRIELHQVDPNHFQRLVPDGDQGALLVEKASLERDAFELRPDPIGLVSQ
jgi:hypothetical protein